MEEFYEVLAHHYVFGENVARAYHYLKASGQKAMRFNSAWEALSCYNKAIAILDQVPADLEQKNKKLEILYLSIPLLISLGFPDNSLTLLEQGERLAKELKDERKLFRFRTNIGFVYSTSGNYKRARPFVEQAFNAAEKLQDIELMSQVIPDLCTTYLAAGEHIKIIDVVSVVISLIEKNQRKDDFFGGPTNIYSILHSFCGLCLAWTGNFKSALTFFEKSDLQATAINDARTLTVYHRMFGGALVLKGEFKNAKKQLEFAIMYNEKLQHTPSMPHSYSWLGLACALAGDSNAGRRHAEKGLEIQADTGYKYLESIGWFCLGVCLAESGEFEAARLNLEKGLKISRNNHERITEGALLIWLGRIRRHCHPPDDERAFENILLGIEISKGLSQRPDEAVGYLFLAELYANRDRKDLAMEYLNKSVALFEQMKMQYWRGEAHKILETIGHGSTLG